MAVALLVLSLSAGVAAAEPVAPGDMEGTVPPEATSTTSTVPAGEARSPGTSPTSGAPANTTTTVPSGPSPEALRRLRELEALSGTISRKQMQVFRAAIELDDIDRDLEATVEEYNLRVLELEEARQRAARLRRELDRTQQEAQAATEALQNRLLGAYKSDTSVLEVLLATTDMADFIKRLSLILSIAQSDRRRMDEVVSLRARSERLLDELSRLIYDVTTASRRLEAQKSLVEAKLAAKQAYIDGLSAEIKVLVERQRRIAGAVVPSGVDIGSYTIGDANQIVKTALRYLGVPYLWGGATPSGFDCSGLVQYVFMQHGLYLPHYSGYQALAGFEVPLRDIQPADLVFFGDPVHHVGIYIGQDLFIHAPSTGDVVKISRLSERRDLSHIRRVTFSLPVGGVPAR